MGKDKTEQFFDQLKTEWLKEAKEAGFPRVQAEFLYEKIKESALSGGIF